MKFSTVALTVSAVILGAESASIRSAGAYQEEVTYVTTPAPVYEEDAAADTYTAEVPADYQAPIPCENPEPKPEAAADPVVPCPEDEYTAPTPVPSVYAGAEEDEYTAPTPVLSAYAGAEEAQYTEYQSAASKPAVAMAIASALMSAVVLAL